METRSSFGNRCFGMTRTRSSVYRVQTSTENLDLLNAGLVDEMQLHVAPCCWVAEHGCSTTLPTCMAWCWCKLSQRQTSCTSNLLETEAWRVNRPQLRYPGTRDM